MKRIKFLLAATFILMLIPTANANMIVNGSFEMPDINTGSFDIFPNIPGWIKTFGSGIEIQNDVRGSSFDGNQHVELDSYFNSGMSQGIPTIAGQSYLLSFAYSPRPGCSSDTNGIDLSFNSIWLDSISADGLVPPNTSWSTFNYIVTATGTLSLLEFWATGESDSLGGYIDNVQFDRAPIPEPATMLLLGSGLIGLAGLRRKFKK